MSNIKTLCYTFLAIIVSFSAAHSQNIQSGPMLGYSEMREVLVWVQTKTEAKVKIKYWVKTASGESFFTDEHISKKENAFVVKCIADKVLPGQKYDYQVLVNGKAEKFDYPLSFQSKTLWQYRSDAPDVKFTLGSCAFINEERFDRLGEPYGGEYEIYTAIYNKKPDFMIWSGDNLYLREADWDTKTGIQHRHTHARSLKELQPLLGSTHNYAIWDDHDFGPNDSDRSFYNKETTTETFKLFWGNNTYVSNLKGTTSQFTWSDCEFFMLDDRYYRSPNNRKSSPCTILGEEQKQWLIDALTFSKATFKFVVVGSQFLNSVATKENFVNCPAERDFILKSIEDERIRGVIFITGDRHHTEVSKLERQGTYALYDFTISPLGSSPHKAATKEVNFYRIPESLLTERNFGQIEITGKKEDRKLKLTVFNVKGEEKYSLVINAKDLK